MARRKEKPKARGWKITCYDGKRRKVYEPELFVGYQDDVARRCDDLMHDNHIIYKCYAEALDDDKDIMIFEWNL